MSDIVERLRAAAPHMVGSCEMIVLAADTITTLRAENERLTAEKAANVDAVVEHVAKLFEEQDQKIAKAIELHQAELTRLRNEVLEEAANAAFDACACNGAAAAIRALKGGT